MAGPRRGRPVGVAAAGQAPPALRPALAAARLGEPGAALFLGHPPAPRAWPDGTTCCRLLTPPRVLGGAPPAPPAALCRAGRRWGGLRQHAATTWPSCRRGHRARPRRKVLGCDGRAGGWGDGACARPSVPVEGCWARPENPACAHLARVQRWAALWSTNLLFKNQILR